jgi:hypothetical protein
VVSYLYWMAGKLRHSFSDLAQAQQSCHEPPFGSRPSNFLHFAGRVSR